VAEVEERRRLEDRRPQQRGERRSLEDRLGQHMAREEGRSAIQVDRRPPKDLASGTYRLYSWHARKGDALIHKIEFMNDTATAANPALCYAGKGTRLSNLFVSSPTHSIDIARPRYCAVDRPHVERFDPPEVLPEGWFLVIVIQRVSTTEEIGCAIEYEGDLKFEDVLEV